MKINSKEARAILELNNFVIFKNYLNPPEKNLFEKAYAEKKSVEHDDGYNYGPMAIMPKYFFEVKSVNDFYNECSNLYGVETSLLLISGNADQGTNRHSDQSNVIHWQCAGKSEWTFYNNPEPNIETKIILNAGDVIWFKKDKDHSVKNLQFKYSIIFNEVELLKNFLTKKYAESGMEF
jgi:tRNA G10  N-methylase Trm11